MSGAVNRVERAQHRVSGSGAMSGRGNKRLSGAERGSGLTESAEQCEGSGSVQKLRSDEICRAVTLTALL